MSTFFAVLLIAHVLFGLVGVMASFRVTFLLIKSTLPIPALIRASMYAFFSYLISWFSGGWYYWKYYGSIVKPKIVGGEFSWAHLVFMEAKEHVFLFMPFATLCIALVLWLKADALQQDPALRKKLMVLSFFVTLLAVIITLSGVLITGGAR